MHSESVPAWNSSTYSLESMVDSSILSNRCRTQNFASWPSPTSQDSSAPESA